MYQLYKFGEKFMSSFYKQHSTITRKKVIEIVDLIDMKIAWKMW